MYSKDKLSKVVFFDIETAPGKDSLGSLMEDDPKMADLWSKRCEYLRSKFQENSEKSDDDLYIEKAALHAEFNRIVCASFGRLTFSEDEAKIVVKSYSSFEELEILQNIEKVFTSFVNYEFCGHSIKRFDVPVMCKRMLINGIQLPKFLQIQNLKPWEVPFMDTSDIWSFGAWQEGFTSLELLSTCLGIPTPKDDIRGEEVGRVFWEENDLPRIEAYCEKDVKAVADVLLKISGLPSL